jgi:hypothetical protein
LDDLEGFRPAVEAGDARIAQVPQGPFQAVKEVMKIFPFGSHVPASGSSARAGFQIPDSRFKMMAGNQSFAEKSMKSQQVPGGSYRLCRSILTLKNDWIPAFAGMTKRGYPDFY